MTTLAFDTSVLSHFARAGHLEVLEGLVKSFRCVAPTAVVEELRAGVDEYAEIEDAVGLGWVEKVDIDELSTVVAFAKYKAEFGGGPYRNNGEASVLAWCQVYGGIALVDDAVARRAAKRDGIETHGTMWLIINGFRDGRLSENDARSMIDDLGASDMRLPTDGKGFLAWAYGEGML